MKTTITSVLKSIGKRFAQKFCRHQVVLGTIERMPDGTVYAKCCKCGKELRANYGLALDCTFTHGHHPT